VPEYANAEDQLRFNRAAMILVHSDSVAVKYRNVAIEDYEHLDRKRYRHQRYRSEIGELRVPQDVMRNNLQLHHIR
jgi:hypothetical protein